MVKSRLKSHLRRRAEWLFRAEIWPERTTPLGRFQWQAGLNSTMGSLILLGHKSPEICLFLLAALLVASIWVHGRWSALFAALCGLSGWGMEVWFALAGPVWTFSVVESWNPTGIPLYMAIGWAMVGLFCMALADVLRPTTQPITPK